MDEDKCSLKIETCVECSAEADPSIRRHALITTGAVARILEESQSIESTQLKVVESAARSLESLGIDWNTEDKSSAHSSAEEVICSGSEDLCWTSDLLHIFVLSEAGKPIYSRYGNESNLSSVMSVMQALVSFVANSGDELQVINTTNKKFLFVSRSHLILVAFSPISEPTSQLLVCLNYVYDQIISSLTLQRVEKQFARHANLDLRKLLVGDNRLLSSIISRVEESFGIFLNATSCTSLSETHRAGISQIICQSAKLQGLVFAILFHKDDIVSFVHMKNQHLSPSDIHLLLNLIGSSQSFKSAQSHWLPICLPKFDANGFLYASVTYLNDTTCMVLLTVDSEKFYPLKSITEKVFTLLNTTHNGDHLSAILSSKFPQISDTGITNLRHFVYKSIPIAQYVTSEWTVPYAITSDLSTESSSESNSKQKTMLLDNDVIQKLRHNVLLSYKRLHMRLHSPTTPTKFIYKVTSTELFFGWRTDTFELYATLEPLITITELGEIRKQLLKWIESKKTQFFILSPPTF
ncbi:hypothetical protein MN116_003501 [Schistosoma mekongi]|uniref:Vacuolar fusion protein MON1 homolog n=1 Tax=Schistosoma mekongi TaxID=38744 RepID=A0AAE2D7L7_SCHME|nr:hypothetical protein MN116_003501 [Schistosoma mekongi]